MNREGVKRAILHVADGESFVWLDIMSGGRVRLRVVTREGRRDLFCDTLEDAALLAAAEPALCGELYGQLLWELDLMGLRGQA